MSYIALYRKYRPQNFKDMVGQEHITKILKNQIATAKISHAYIFSGTRGTGKTTAAKVFARAINCLNPIDGEPCNICEACQSILQNNTTDVVEMDAASNNSVENIRSIRQEVAYSTTGMKYKVYIIDEAHMLSTSAFNALLKTLEEPPKNVVFILATTEEHKILPTILSRCIRFEFKKLNKEQIVSRLRLILKDYNSSYEEEALERIAELADGAMRDALSILERCVTSDDGSVTLKRLEDIVGTVPKKIIEEIVLNVLEYNLVEVENLVDTLVSSGKDLRNIASNITELFLKILVGASSSNLEDIPDTLKNATENVSITRVYEIIKHMSALDDRLRQTNNVGLIFKAKLLELTTKVTPLEENELLAKLEELEMKLEKLQSQGVKVVNVVPKEKVEPTKKEVEKATIIQTKEQNMQKPKRKQIKQKDKIMKKAIELDNLKLYSALAGTEVFEENENIIFETTNAFAYDVLNKDTSRQELKNIVSEELDTDANVLIEYIKPESHESTTGFENLMKEKGIPFEMVD